MPQANQKSLREEFVHPFARLLRMPLANSGLVYRYAEVPPGLEGYQPRWEVVNAVLGAQQTIQVKVDLMRDFHLLAILASALHSDNGGFRAHIAHIWIDDTGQPKSRRIGSDRGIKFGLLGGNTVSPFFLREPYRFDIPRSQALVILQNLELVANTVQLVLYGVAAPFTGSDTNP